MERVLCRLGLSQHALLQLMGLNDPFGSKARCIGLGGAGKQSFRLVPTFAGLSCGAGGVGAETT